MKIFIILYSLSLIAAPIGNPSVPAILEEGFFICDTSWCNFQWGVTGDWLMQQRYKKLALHRIELAGSTETGFVTWNISERLNLEMDLGTGQFSWKWQQKDVAILGQLWGGLLWSGSAKLIVFEIRDTSLAADVHAGGWDFMEGHATSNGIPEGGTVHGKLRYWQAAVALSQKIALFFPYIGVAVNQSRLKIKGLESTVGWLNCRHSIGPFLGVTLSQGDDIALNVEWRSNFEQGVAISGQIRF